MTVTPGAILEIRTAAGLLHGWVQAPVDGYPPILAFLPAVTPHPLADPAAVFEGADLQCFLVPLDPACRAGQVREVAVRPLGPAPVFRVPILNRVGAGLYDWVWQSGELRLRQPDDPGTLPLREIVPLQRVAGLLAAVPSAGSAMGAASG